jgi:hypothetical protein
MTTETFGRALNRVSFFAAVRMTDRLSVTESKYNGETWMRPVRSDFSDENAKLAFGGGDGRYWYIGNPVLGGGRNPLISPYPMTERHSTAGIRSPTNPSRANMSAGRKVGTYGYPDAIIRNGTVYAVCSINKEDIRGFSFPLLT